MACLNVLSQDNYINANITLAQLFGLHVAVYWSELSKVLSKVKKKKKFDENGYFKLDREYIKTRTTLTVEEQNKCDQILVEAGVLAIDSSNPDRVSVDVKLLLNLIINGDENTVMKKSKVLVNKVNSADKKASKIAAMKTTLKKFIVESDEELYKAYCDWVDVLVENKRINRVGIEQFQKTVNDFCADVNVKKVIVGIAAAHMYIDAQWAISKYKNMYLDNPTNLKPQKVNTGVKEGIEF